MIAIAKHVDISRVEKDSWRERSHHNALSLTVSQSHTVTHTHTHTHTHTPVWNVPQSTCMAVMSSGMGTTAGFLVVSSSSSSPSGPAPSVTSLSRLGSPSVKRELSLAKTTAKQSNVWAGTNSEGHLLPPCQKNPVLGVGRLRPPGREASWKARGLPTAEARRCISLPGDMHTRRLMRSGS